MSTLHSSQVPLVSVNGEGISRNEHRRWWTFVQERCKEISEYHNGIFLIIAQGMLICMDLSDLPACTCFRNGHCIAIGLSESMDILEQQSTNRRLPETADYHTLLISYHPMSLTKP
ncbi:hypothetical protein BDR06DRAFT_690526 [Suillus hirtellus]|nr:hypothetical protein BDR06DRAFT_690526 [Suillus hirtellus]